MFLSFPCRTKLQLVDPLKQSLGGRDMKFQARQQLPSNSFAGNERGCIATSGNNYTTSRLNCVSYENITQCKTYMPQRATEQGTVSKLHCIFQASNCNKDFCNNKKLYLSWYTFKLRHLKWLNSYNLLDKFPPGKVFVLTTGPWCIWFMSTLNMKCTLDKCAW